MLEETSVLDTEFVFGRASVVLEGMSVVLEGISVPPGGTSVEGGSVGTVELDATESFSRMRPR